MASFETSWGHDWAWGLDPRLACPRVQSRFVRGPEASYAELARPPRRGPPPMKFVCDNCQAKYQIGDDKVAGKTVRMKCRKCGYNIKVTCPAPRSGRVR